MPVKKSSVKKTLTSLRGMYQNGTSRGNLIKKIASSKTPRNDDKRPTRGLSVPIYSLSGRAAGTLALPKEIFGQNINKNLLAQAVRVYMTNQKQFTASTKTRGEIRGSTAKIYRQKGTGRARHGSIRAPIFVGGGIVFGPKPREVKLSLPQKMKKAALISALSSKVADKNVVGLTGIEKASGKTKQIFQLLSKITEKGKKQPSVLILTGEIKNNVVRAVRNIHGVDVLPANLINAYEVLRHETLMLTKEAVSVILGRDSGRASLARMTKESKK